jgi:hypothetical protein
MQNSKKNLDSYCSVTSYDFLSLKNGGKAALKSNKQNTGVFSVHLRK